MMSLNVLIDSSLGGWMGPSSTVSAVAMIMIVDLVVLSLKVVVVVVIGSSDWYRRGGLSLL